jgi:hypothetical protein
MDMQPGVPNLAADFLLSMQQDEAGCQGFTL